MDRDSVLRAFGDRVRAHRARLGISQEALAESAGFHRNFIGGIERGERNVPLVTIHRLAAALGVAPEELVSRAGDSAK